MISTFSTRLFQLEDARPVTDLLHAAYAELGAMGLNYTAVDQSVETIVMRAQAGRCWIVEKEGDLLGTLTLSLPPSSGLRTLTPEATVPGRAWLNQVAVSPAARGEGIAAHLWRESRKWAVMQGATSVGVDTAVPAAHLITLYSKWGFAQADTIRHDGKVYESVVMIRELGSEDG
jgi:GNAT superfamily N-acetyltransferase